MNFYSFILNNLQRRMYPDPTEDLGKCRRVNLELVMDINRSHLDIIGIALVDRQFTGIKDTNIAEHVIGMAIDLKHSEVIIFDGTTGQLSFEAPRPLIFNGHLDELEQLIQETNSHLHGDFSTQIIGYKMYQRFDASKLRQDIAIEINHGLH